MNKRKPIFWEIFFLIILIAVLHKVALVFFLYWTTGWYDIMMHLLGGFWLSISIIFIFFTSGHIRFPKEHKPLVFLFTISGVLVIGLGWELWELFAGLTDVLEDLIDTVIDVIMDSIGGTLAFIYYKKYIWPEN
ncbi:MAG: hypothetical protein ACI9GH_000372 [Candidatus Paceibacteria bacterium]|jgi:hypothetical protein